MTMLKAVSAGAVVDSVGVNTHIDFGSGGYAHVATTGNSIAYLGLKFLRDCPAKDSDLQDWATVAAACGGTFCAFVGETAPVNVPDQAARMAVLARDGLLHAVEGCNEHDAAYAQQQGCTLALAAGFQQTIMRPLGDQTGLPVVNMSFGAGWTSANNWQGNYGSVGDLSAWCDYANAHTYPGATQHCGDSMDRLNHLALLAATTRPVMVTEIGFPDPQFSEALAARYAVCAVVDGLLLGVRRTFFYGLYDDIAGKFGIMRSDGSPKPAGTAIRSLLQLLADDGPAAAAPDSLDVVMSGAAANDKTLLFQRAGGDFLLVLWNEKDAAHAVSITLPAGSAKAVNLYDPLVGVTPMQQVADPANFTVNVPDHPVIAEIIMGVAPPPPPLSIQVPTAITLTPASSTLMPDAALGTPVCDVAVATSDNLPFTGVLTVPLPLQIAFGKVVVGAQLPSGPTSFSAVVAATGNGTTVTATEAVTVQAPAPPAPPPAPKLVAHPVWGPPAALQALAGKPLHIAGLAVSDQYAVGHPGTCALNVHVTRGTVSAQASGAASPYPGSGTAQLAKIDGPIEALNAALAALTYSAATAGDDVLTLEFFDQGGVRAKLTIPVKTY